MVPLKLADELINKFGQYEMAKGLEEMQTIVPYALGEKFTKGLGGKFQAHKIFERRAFEDVLKMDEKALKDAVDNAPTIILTDARHAEISKAGFRP